MARKRFTLNFDDFPEYMAKLDEIGSTQAMKRGVESALKAAKQHVNPKIDAIMIPGKMPAHGTYWTGDTKESLDRDMTVEWEGMKGRIKVGFDFKKSGLTSILLMQGVDGTPRQAPVPGLKAAIYGAKTQKEVAEIEKEAIRKVINEIMEG